MEEKEEKLKYLQKENKRLQEANKQLVENLRFAREKVNRKAGTSVLIFQIKTLQDDQEKQNQVQEELSMALSSVN